MKKLSSLLMSILLLSGCNSNVSSSTYKEKEIKDIIISGYEEKLEYFKDFDDEEITLKVVYDDNSEKVYNNLTFDYSNFSNTTLGKQIIEVSLKELNIKENIEVEVIPSKSFSLLMVGNSFSDDTVQWVNEICEALDIEVNIANLYIGGCDLNTHYRNLTNDKSSYEYRKYNKDSKKWVTKSSTSISQALMEEEYDIVSLQQASGSSGISSTYENLPHIIDELLFLNENLKFVWNMTWAYQQNSTHSDFGKYNKSQSNMYESIVNVVQEEVETNEYIDLIIPNGTSIQNARTSFVGDNLTRDGYHLSYDFGRYIAGLTLVSKLTGTVIDDISYAPVGVNENYKRVALEAVKNAIINPYETSESSFKVEPEVDLTNHVEIDYKPVGSAYYNSTDTNNYNKYITTANNSISFIASKKFTKEELPNGSIIEIKSGFQYRPEGWIKDAPMTSREDNVTTKYIEVNDAWWKNYTIRAFNISMTNTQDLTYSMKEAMEAFSIYVPKDLYIEEEKTNYKDIDSSLFTSNSLNIDNYTLYDYDYYNGFYDSSNYSDRHIVYNNTSLSNKYICTESFRIFDLPIGSIIIVDEGYEFRQDGWINNSKNTNRRDKVTTPFTIVDVSWWDNYTVVGFNISKVDGSVINQNPHEVAEHFRIYIPN